MEVVIILPNQLFEDNKMINQKTQVYLYEHPVNFTLYKYHKLKLILHRSSMKSYQDYLEKTYRCHVTYIEFHQDLNKIVKKYKNKQIDIYDPVDFHIITDLKKVCKKYQIELFVHDSPLFLLPIADLQNYLDQGGKYHQTSFYIWQRKKLNILVDKNEKPIGGKWTFDKDNRLPFPKTGIKDQIFKVNLSKYVVEGKKYIEKYFKDNPGSTDLYLEIDHQGAKKHLQQFLKERLNCFGPYQDAVSKNIIFGCHTVLSPMTNIGLLTHKYIVDEVLKYYAKNKNKINFASVEGLIRQIVGWASFTRLVYMFRHKELISNNHFNHKRKIGKSWYTGETGIEPIDDLIKKVLKYGYLHHIERLMYIGNFMLLCEFDPMEVNRWFMSLCALDSYHVFMDTNVNGMSQYASANLFTTRPYFSASNYISKMSDYKKVVNKYKKIVINGQNYEWYEIWDALYYNFVNNHKKEFSKNYSLANTVSQWNKKSNSEKSKLLEIAKKFLQYGAT
jgi:deoxyribodipyrimidine photolyase-related protein